MLPGGDDLPISDLLCNGADLGADLGARGTGHHGRAGHSRDVRHSNGRLAFGGAGVRGQPGEMKSYQGAFEL